MSSKNDGLLPSILWPTNCMTQAPTNTTTLTGSKTFAQGEQQQGRRQRPPKHYGKKHPRQAGLDTRLAAINP